MTTPVLARPIAPPIAPIRELTRDELIQLVFYARENLPEFTIPARVMKLCQADMTAHRLAQIWAECLAIASDLDGPDPATHGFTGPDATERLIEDRRAALADLVGLLLPEATP